MDEARVATREEVASYWFGDNPDQPWAHARMWFEAGRDLDADVRGRFGATVEAALRGDLDEWKDSPEGRVALLVVFDQFTRHVFRDTPRFVEGDRRAQALALGLLDDGAEEALDTARLLFVLTALEHAEDRVVQARGLQEAKRLAALHPEDLGDMVEYVRDHHDIVQRFGRFPDRNRLLGRTSTPEEREFLRTEHRGWFET